MRKKKVLLWLPLVVAIVLTGWTIYNRLYSIINAENTKTVDLQNGQTFNLTASRVKKEINDKAQDMLAYNGSIPGPTLKVRQGDSVTVNFTNKLDQDTAVHFHGVRTENASDGVVDVTQAAVKPGGSYTYNLTFPDPGAYWYHPHLREDATQPLGLYGNIIVEPKDTAYWSPVNKEIPLMIGDVLMDGGAILPFDRSRADFTLMGRFGNTLLVNGETDYRISAVTGEVLRLYLTNVASTRPFNLQVSGGRMKLVGGDSGAYERQAFVESVTIGPSERAIVDVMFDKAGEFKLQNKTPQKTYDLAAVTIKNGAPKPSYAAAFSSLETNNEVISSIDPFRSGFNKTADKAITLSLDMPGVSANDTSTDMSMPGMDMSGTDMQGMDMSGMDMSEDTDKIEWEDAMPAVNKSSTTESLTWKIVDQATNAENEDINWTFKRGEQVKLKIFNDPNSAHPMQHPIHVHGQRFLVTSINGQPVENQVWKDTVLVGKGDTVEFLIDTSNPGTWLIHCHIPEHMESGMQFKYTVQ